MRQSAQCGRPHALHLSLASSNWWTAQPAMGSRSAAAVLTEALAAGNTGALCNAGSGWRREPVSTFARAAAGAQARPEPRARPPPDRAPLTPCGEDRVRPWLPAPGRDQGQAPQSSAERDGGCVRPALPAAFSHRLGVRERTGRRDAGQHRSVREHDRNRSASGPPGVRAARASHRCARPFCAALAWGPVVSVRSATLERPVAVVWRWVLVPARAVRADFAEGPAQAALIGDAVMHVTHDLVRNWSGYARLPRGGRWHSCSWMALAARAGRPGPDCGDDGSARDPLCQKW
jgi:hypothetical protein